MNNLLNCNVKRLREAQLTLKLINYKEEASTICTEKWHHQKNYFIIGVWNLVIVQTRRLSPTPKKLHLIRLTRKKIGLQDHSSSGESSMISTSDASCFLFSASSQSFKQIDISMVDRQTVPAISQHPTTCIKGSLRCYRRSCRG